MKTLAHNTMTVVARPSLLYALIKAIPSYITTFFLYPYLLLIEQYAGLPKLSSFGIASLINIYFILRIYMVKFEFNEDYISITKGVLSRERKTIEMFRVKDIKETKPFLLRLIGVMNVELITSQKFSKFTTLKGVRNNDFIGLLRDNILDQRNKNRVFEVDS